MQGNSLLEDEGSFIFEVTGVNGLVLESDISTNALPLTNKPSVY